MDDGGGQVVGEGDVAAVIVVVSAWVISGRLSRKVAASLMMMEYADWVMAILCWGVVLVSWPLSRCCKRRG